MTTQFLVDTNNLTGYAQVVEERVGGIVQRSYQYGLDLISQRRFVGSSYISSYYSYDGHGSVRALTAKQNANDGTPITDTYTYDAFGNLSSNVKINRLNQTVSQGNRWGAEYLVRHLKQLDGGNLEDALVALGQFSSRDMERLLAFSMEGLLSKQELTDALTMLPLSLSDNAAAQLSSLSLRRRKAMRVTRSDLLEQRKHALEAIDDFVAEIRSKQGEK